MTGKQEEMKNGHILGLIQSGCKYLKQDEKYLYFDVPNELENDSLQAINTTLYHYTGLKLKIRRV